MRRGRSDRPEEGANRRDAAFVLPLFGAILLLPPFLNLFLVRRLLWGIPLEVIYLFTVWVTLVLGAWWLSRGLNPHPPRDKDSASEAAQGQGNGR